MQVGARLRTLRTSRGLTVGALAEQTALSKGLISQIENDKVSPSLATLERLAEGLRVPVAYLLLRPADGIQVVRAHDRVRYHMGLDGGITVEVLSDSSRNLKAALLELPPGCSSGCESHAHAGEELHLLLEGRVQALQADEAVVLEPGDAWHWHGCTPHRIVNLGETPARLLVITSATVLEGVGSASEPAG